MIKKLSELKQLWLRKFGEYSAYLCDDNEVEFWWDKNVIRTEDLKAWVIEQIKELETKRNDIINYKNSESAVQGFNDIINWIKENILEEEEK